jgi:hypothetical protein
MDDEPPGRQPASPQHPSPASAAPPGDSPGDADVPLPTAPAAPPSGPRSDEEESGSARGLRRRVLEGLRRDAAGGATLGARAAAEVGEATEAMALEIVPTGLVGERVLVGHALGMHLSVPASGFHGPRESPALVYLFADALAVRPTDDAPMSTVPVLGLHMVLPPLAIARWIYKAGRVEHANIDLVKDAQRFADSFAQWTVDDFAAADTKLQVHRASDLPGPLHVYEHLGFANVRVPVQGGGTDHLKSALPVTSDAFVRLWKLFALVNWPAGLSTEVPGQERQGEPPS